MFDADVSPEDRKGTGARQLTKMRLLNGPCDPRDVEMKVSLDAKTVTVRPMPFDLQDEYVITERFVDNGEVLAATAEYQRTLGPRKQTDAYRKALGRLGAGRAFKVKRTVAKEIVH